MRIAIKNLTPKVVQNEVTQAEIDRLEEKKKTMGLSAREKMRLYNLKTKGANAPNQNKCLHPEPEMPAEVPTFENPTGTITKKEAQEREIKHRMVEEVNAKGEERRFDEAGDPISFKAEEMDEKALARIIKEIKSGVSPYQACINKRVLPDEFFKECKNNPAWQRELDEAREVYAESQIARLETLSHQLEKNKIDAVTYAQITGNIKWLAEKLFPVLYGNKTKVDQTVTHSIEINQDKLRELNDLLRGNPKPLEVEYQEV